MRPAAVLSLALLLSARRLDAVTTPLTPHSPLLHTPHLHSPWPHVPRRCAIALKGPPPIVSRYFESLLTPAQFEELLEKAPSDAVSIIKFQATYCRTCRATAPLLDRVAKKYPTAKFYDLTLARDGKLRFDVGDFFEIGLVDGVEEEDEEPKENEDRGND